MSSFNLLSTPNCFCYLSTLDHFISIWKARSQRCWSKVECKLYPSYLNFFSHRSPQNVLCYIHTIRSSPFCSLLFLLFSNPHGQHYLKRNYQVPDTSLYPKVAVLPVGLFNGHLQGKTNVLISVTHCTRPCSLVSSLKVSSRNRKCTSASPWHTHAHRWEPKTH